MVFHLTPRPLHAFLLKTGLLQISAAAATPNWNVVLSSLSNKGLTFLASKAFAAAHRLAFALDSYSLCSALAAAAQGNDLGFVGKIHVHAWKSGWISSVFVGGALVASYARLGDLRDARKMFDEMPVKNVVCGNALLCGYCREKRWLEGFELVRLMETKHLEPDGFTFSILLKMCAEFPAWRLGTQAHAHLLRRTFLLEEDVFVLSSLVEMYGKCGFVEKARTVFSIANKDRGGGGGRTAPRDVVLWTSLLNAYSRNGWFEEVVATFEDMLADGITPDGVTFVAVLSASSRVGRVAEGLAYFESMRRDHGIVPTPEHYSCAVDLLCRGGELDKALELAKDTKLHRGDGEMDAKMSVGVWGALLSACRESGDLDMGEFAARRALELDPCNRGVYVELSNMYAKFGRWVEIEKLRGEMKGKKDLSTELGSTKLEVIATSLVS